MFNQSRQDVIVLCLDIDNTIHNPNTYADGKLDFNGENGPLQHVTQYDTSHKTTKWYQLLNELKQACEAKGVELITQIISAKEGCEVDCTVDAVVSTLHPFLEPLNQQGETYKNHMTDFFHMPKSYLYAKHQGKITKHRQKNCFYRGSYLDLHDYDTDALPVIHIVHGNREQGRVNSKAAVMQFIEAELIKRGKNPLGMLLVDDRKCFAQAVNGAGYQFICAGMLREATGHHERGTRATYTTDHLMPRITNAVTQILTRWRLQKQQMYYMALRSPR